MTESIAVQITNLGKRFDHTKLPALDQVTARIMFNQITGLVGPDGAGKTTLIRLIAGLLLPSQGRIEVFGLDSVKRAADIQNSISYMPQRFGLYEDLSVQENLNLYADLHNIVGKSRDGAFAELLKFTDLQRFTTRLAGNLSGGDETEVGACMLSN